MSMCRVFSCVVGRGCLLWSVCSLGKTLLAFALLHVVFQGQICLLLQVSPTSAFQSPIVKRSVSSRRSCRSSSVQFSHAVMSDSLQPHGLQHTRPLCPSPTPGVYSNSYPLSHWCHPTISSSVVPFSHLQSFPASGSFPMSQLFTTSGGQSNKSFSFSTSPSNEYSGQISFRMDWLDLAVQRTLKSLLQHHSSKASILLHSAFFLAQLSHPYVTTRKTIALTWWTFVGK